MSGRARADLRRTSSASPDPPPGPPRTPELRSQLDAIWRQAREVWPSVELDAETFFAHLARHAPGNALGAEALGQLCTADLYLACGCGLGDLHAIAAFERHCIDGLDRPLARLRFDAQVITEVKQVVRCRILVAEDGPPRILEFGGRGPLRAWVRVIAVREAFRLTRRPAHELAGDDGERLHAFVALAAGGLDREKARCRQLFSEAFDRALRALPVRDRTMLRQHVLDGMTIDELAALYRVHRATAARTLERTRHAVLAGVRAEMRARLEVSSTELNSILRMIRSQLEISLRGLRRRR